MTNEAGGFGSSDDPQMSADDGRGAYHVVPVNDRRAHDESDAATCWCRPTVREEAGGHLIVHNSADGRERWEDSRS